MTGDPETGARCTCKRGVQRDNCPACEGTGRAIDFAALHRARRQPLDAVALYHALLAAGVPLDSHASDLYVRVTDVSRALVQRYRWRAHVTTFVSQLDGLAWYDIPFAHVPFWARREREAAKERHSTKREDGQ